MDPGEQITGTRDEHYNLVSVLYHALHGAETMEEYILDAEAAGDEEMAAFFLEAQGVQVRIAESAKGMLGIVEATPSSAAAVTDEEILEEEVIVEIPEAGVVPEEGLAPGASAPAGEMEPLAGTDPAENVVPEGTLEPGTSAPGTEPLAGEEIPPERTVGDLPPTTGSSASSPAEDLASLDEMDTLPGDVASPNLPEVAGSRIAPEDLDSTVSALRGGVENLAIERALAEIDGWETKLEESGDPQLAPIAENLRRLRTMLTAGSINRDAVGEILSTLGDQVREVASGSLGESIADRLQQLGSLLANEARSVSG